MFGALPTMEHGVLSKPIYPDVMDITGFHACSHILHFLVRFKTRCVANKVIYGI